MFKGLMVVNAFLRTTKFDDIYHTLLEAARPEGILLDVMTNAELSPVVDSFLFDPALYDFVLFWDKDVQLAMQLEQRGLRVFNSAQSILRCDDKALTYLTLKQAGLPMPRTILAPKTFTNIGYPQLSFLDDVAKQLGWPVVVKECFGSFGQQVYLCRTMDELQQTVADHAGTPLLFQQLISESFGHDVRVNVVGGKVVASMHRRSTDGDFRSNLTRGGAMEPWTATPEQAGVAIRAVEALGLDFAGVDVLFGKDGPLICEVNSNAHFKTTLECTGVNMAAEIMKYIAGKLGTK
ncbi:MAG: RimK family alpha-L-glutamate ligase [Clostridia bacterium]|nr:RimK family alpha-L-glutamate ligase [Clostridia bacterium]